MKKTALTLSAIVLLATGCTSDSSLRAEVTAAKEEAAKARQEAQQARLAAQDAKAMSVRTDEKLNRMFRKAQMK